MYKIQTQDYKNIIQQYLKTEYDFLLIRAVLERKQRGEIWVDKLENPGVIFVINNFGFCYLFGSNEQEFKTVLESLIFVESELEYNYLLLYAPKKTIQPCLESLDRKVRIRYRNQFEFDSQKFKRSLNQFDLLPVEFKVEKLTNVNLQKTEIFDLNLGERYWKSYDDFLKNGYGFGVFDKSGNIVSLCYSACVVDNRAEIDVATLEEYKGKNLASHCVKSFIDYSLSIDIFPNWDCFENNIPSVKIAERFGFNKKRKYPFYTIDRSSIKGRRK